MIILKRIFIKHIVMSGFGGLVVSMLASGTQVRGFKLGRSRRIFFGRINPQLAFFRKGSKEACDYMEVGS
jgi:hypothetical protein